MVAETILFLHRLLRKRLSASFLLLHRRISRSKSQKNPSSLSVGYPCLRTICNSNQLHTLVFDLETSLLLSSSTFPYFMLVAMEAGGFLRAFLLLLLYPLVWFLGEGEEMGIKLMAFVSFCGLRKDGFRVGRAVLPKHFLESVGMEALEVLLKGWRRRVCISSMPKVIVEGFLKEYLGVELVVGREMKVVGGYYTGFMGDDKDKEELVLKELFGSAALIDHQECVTGFTGSSNKCPQTPYFSKCKEVFVVNEAQRRSCHALPREKYPRPLVFHDGRIAFRPTPPATLAMFLWLPLGFLLAIFRAIIFLSLPHKLSIPISALTGMKSRLITSTTATGASSKRHLYVCNHRTLLDPIYISAALGKAVTAVTYSVSRVSEILSPIKTVRLTRNREEDKRRMDSNLKQGDLVVCPEGTTCREPFLLRFSPLFTELSDEVVPVALEVSVSMFYGTTAGGIKCFDPLFFLMNPFPSYNLGFLGKIEMSSSRHGDCNGSSSYVTANMVQNALGEALGYQCTSLTRKDKYLMLAGNEGVVADC